MVAYCRREGQWLDRGSDLGHGERRMESGMPGAGLGRSLISWQASAGASQAGQGLPEGHIPSLAEPCLTLADQVACLASTSSWPRGRCRWRRKPCRISTAPCAATWTSQGPRAIACSESPAGLVGWPRSGGAGVSRAKCRGAGHPGPGLPLDILAGWAMVVVAWAWPGHLFGPTVCLPRRCWTTPLSPYMSSGRMRPPGEGMNGV